MRSNQIPERIDRKMTSKSDTRPLFSTVLQWLRTALSSPIAYAAIFTIAATFTFLGQEVYGALVFVIIISIYLAVFDDLISSMLPFLLICTFTLKCYDSFDTFMAYKWIAVPAVAAVIFHFAYYRKKITLGENFTGVCAVAVAVTLGGLFSISPSDYFRGISLYYVFALGIGMVAGYLIIRASLEGRPIDESSKRFTVFMYLWGVFAMYMVYQFIWANAEVIAETNSIPYFQWSNNISTVMMFSLPFPFYFGLKKWWHLIPGYLMYGAIMLTGSRGGMLFGTAEILIITVYVIFASRKHLPRIIVVGTMAVAALAMVKNWFGITDLLNFDALTKPEEFISSGEPRIILLKRSIEDFKSNILFGRGLGYQGNIDAYNPKKGSLYFYHMMIPQIIGSMGLCGIIGYGWQFILRIRTLLRRIDNYTVCLFISYLGVFMMSQVNPGEFVPLPYSLIAVTIFVIMEKQPRLSKKAAALDI